MASSQHRCVFVGNIPYDATEEQLKQICEEVGPVVSFRLVIDRETGKPKGYGFCEYKDEETALSARRNLQGYEINGRQLRVDFAENDKNADRNREQGRGGPGMVTNIDPQKQVGGPAFPRDSGLHQPIGLSVAMAAASLMVGTLGGPQTTNTNQNFPQGGQVLGSDPLTLHLAKMSRNQLNEIMSEMKVMATLNKEKARQLLLASPPFSKALLQVEIMLGLVTPQMLQMPNVRLAPGPLAQSVLQAGQQGQLPDVQTLPGLPPLVPIKMQSSLMTQGKEGQVSAVSQLASQPQIQLPQLAQSQIQQQAPLSVQLGISTFPSIRPQPLSNVSIRPQIQVAVSSSLKQTAQPLLLQKPGQTGSSGVGHGNQLVGPNITIQHSHFVRPPLQEQGFQPSSSILLEKSSLLKDSLDPLNHSSKMVKLDDGRSTPFLMEYVKTSASVSGPPQALGMSRNQIHKAAETSSAEKQAPQLQLPPEVESALLQQVMNLTPEQLSLLPPDQQQQVIQLQQMLRQST